MLNNGTRKIGYLYRGRWLRLQSLLTDFEVYGMNGLAGLYSREASDRAISRLEIDNILNNREWEQSIFPKILEGNRLSQFKWVQMVFQVDSDEDDGVIICLIICFECSGGSSKWSRPGFPTRWLSWNRLESYDVSLLLPSCHRLVYKDAVDDHAWVMPKLTYRSIFDVRPNLYSVLTPDVTYSDVQTVEKGKCPFDWKLSNRWNSWVEAGPSPTQNRINWTCEV